MTSPNTDRTALLDAYRLRTTAKVVDDIARWRELAAALHFEIEAHGDDSQAGLSKSATAVADALAGYLGQVEKYLDWLREAGQ